MASTFRIVIWLVGADGEHDHTTEEKRADLIFLPVLYHQPEKMAKSKEDLAERQENLERLKQQHGIS